MPSINMIAARRAEKKKLEQKIRTVLLVMLCQVVLCFGILSFTTARAVQANSRIRQLDKELKRLEPTVAKISQYEREIKGLKPKLELLDSSRKKTLLWYSVLGDLSRSMPQSTWLVSLTSSGVANTSSNSSDKSSDSKRMSPMISLRGTTTSQRLVGETMLRLNQWPEFDKVSLSYTQKGADARKEVVDFEIAAQLKPFGSEGGNKTDATTQTL